MVVWEWYALDMLSTFPWDVIKQRHEEACGPRPSAKSPPTFVTDASVIANCRELPGNARYGVA
jgi:hypothetical protein